MKTLWLLPGLVMLLAVSAISADAPRPVYGVGHIIVNPERQPSAKTGEVEAALEVAEHCREFGLNHINLLGPLLYRDTDFDPGIRSLIARLHNKGLTVSFCINTFLDVDKQHGDWSWRDRKGRPIGGKHFCLSAARKARVPEIRKCILRGVQAGFDGVLLDFLDWGTENDKICFCSACIRDFNAYARTRFSRDELSMKTIVDESIVAAWWDWRMKVRNDIAAELVKCGREAGRKYKRDFWVAQCAGRIGSEPEYCGSVFDVHAPMIYGSKAGGTIESYDEIARACRTWKRRTPGTSKVVALLNCGRGDPPPGDTPPGELRELARAAMAGGADGWIFVPGAKLSGDDWEALHDSVASPGKP